MPAARYWRAVGIETYSGDGLELSELHLYDAGGRVDMSATLTCTHAPAVGVLSNINDDDTASVVGWPQSAVSAPGFALVWDFGAGVTKTCTGVRMGAGTTSALSLAGLTLECLDGGVWVAAGTFNRFPWPGANTYGNPPLRDYVTVVLDAVPACYLRLGETSGTTALDASGNSRTGTYSVSASTLSGAGLVAGSDLAMSLPGTSGAKTGVVLVPPINTANAWTFECVIKPTGAPVNDSVGCIVQMCDVLYGDIGAVPEIDVVDVGGGNYKLRVMASGISELFRSTQTMAYGVRKHITLVYAPTIVVLYIDGVAAGSAAVAYSHPNTGFNIGFAQFIGSASYYPLKGVVDEVAFYSRALSADEAAEHTAAMDVSTLTPQVFLARTLRTRQTARAQPYAWHGNPGNVQAKATGQQYPYRDLEFGGRCAIAGFTKTKGSPNAPFRCRVRLLRDRDALLVRETWSDAATGAFVFAGLDEAHTSTAFAQDHTGNYRAVVADRITAEVPA